MPKFITKIELAEKKSDNQNDHNVGEIYPQIFSHDKNLEFSENMPLEAGIIWLGAYYIENNPFPKVKCPICGKKEALIPYKAIGSPLSGCHTISFWCKNCHEQFVTNDYIEYFRLIVKYIKTNKEELKHKMIKGRCSVQTSP